MNTSLTTTVACHSSILPPDQLMVRLFANLPLAVFGTIANLTSLLVFAQKPMIKSKINWFLMALTLSEIALLLTNLAFVVLPALAEFTQWPSALAAFPYVLRLVQFTVFEIAA